MTWLKRFSLIRKGGIKMNWVKIKIGFWSTAQKMAAEMTSAAMVDRLAPLCLVRFNQDPEKDQKLAVLKKTDSWQRYDYVEKQGWATISGEKEPDSQVAIECVSRIMQISS
jgi:hypothetical protein